MCSDANPHSNIFFFIEYAMWIVRCSSQGGACMREFQVGVDAEERLVLLKPEVAERLGLMPGATVRRAERSGLLARRDDTGCPRSTSSRPPPATSRAARACGMSGTSRWARCPATRLRIAAGIEELSCRSRCSSAGSASRCLPGSSRWCGKRRRGARSSKLITSSTLLDENRSRQLIAAGLDRLWVSLDGATPESYTDVRLGAALPTVIANVERFRSLRPTAVMPAGNRDRIRGDGTQLPRPARFFASGAFSRYDPFPY